MRGNSATARPAECAWHIYFRDANSAIEEGCNVFALEFKWLPSAAVEQLHEAGTFCSITELPDTVSVTRRRFLSKVGSFR